MTQTKKQIMPALHDSGKVSNPDLPDIGERNYTATILKYANLALPFPQLETDAKQVVPAINEVRVIPNPTAPSGESYEIVSQGGYVLVTQDGDIITTGGDSDFPDLNTVLINGTIYRIAGGGGYVLPIASANTLGGIRVGSGLSIDSNTGILSSSDALENLHDVDLENVTDGQTLVYDGETEKWVNRDGGGDYTAGYGIYFSGDANSVINAEAGRLSPPFSEFSFYSYWDTTYTIPCWEDSGETVDGHTVYQSNGNTYMQPSGSSTCRFTVGGYDQFTIYAKQNPATSDSRYVVFGHMNVPIDLENRRYDRSCQGDDDADYIARTYYLYGSECTVELMYHKDPFEQGTSVDLKDGQFVDSGETVDGHTVYKSDAGSYHISYGSSVCTITVAGITSFTIYYRSSSEENYDYAYVGQLDTDVSRYSYRTRMSGNYTYSAVTFECSAGEHTVQIMYAKDSSVDRYDDRAYFYYVINEYAPAPPDDDRAYAYIVLGNVYEAKGEIFNDYTYNRAIGENSHAEGTSNKSLGYATHSEGYGNFVSGSYAHGEGIDNKVYGSASHAEGGQNQTIGEKSHAEGMDNIAQGSYSHAEGAYTQAIGERSHTEGYGTIAQGHNSHAEGKESQALALRSHAEGVQSIARGDTSHAEGWCTQANGGQSHSEGYHSIANGGQSHAEGYETQTNGSDAHAEGSNTVADGSYSHAEGYRTITYSSGAHAEGEYSIASGSGAHAEGYGDSTYHSVASGQGSHAEGQSTASNSFAHSEGMTTLASGQFSHAEGYYSNATAIGTHAEGYSTRATGDNSHAEGGGCQSSGKESHAEGSGTNACGYSSHAEGAGTWAYTMQAHAEGSGTRTYGQASHVEGAGNINTVTNGHTEGAGNLTLPTAYNSHTEGGGNYNYGPQSHAEGSGNTISGEESHIEGAGNNVHGPKNHAEGGGNSVYGLGSHVEGKHNKAFGYGLHAEGAYNIIGNPDASVFSYGTTYAIGDLVVANSIYNSFSGAESDYGYVFRCITAPGQIQAQTGVQIVTPTSWNSSTSYAAGSVVACYVNYNCNLYFYCNSSVSAGDDPLINANNSWNLITSYLSPLFGCSYSGYYLLNNNAYSISPVAIVSDNTTVAPMWEKVATPSDTHIEGFSNIAIGDYQHVGGKYNVADANKAMIIGNGVDEDHRSNALTLDWSGNAVISGDLTTGTVLSTTAQTVGAAINELNSAIPSVSVTQIETTGTKIATVTVNGNATDLYAPISGGGGSTTLAGLSDVTLTTPTNGQALIYDSANSKWINSNVPSGSSTLDGLTDVTITSATSGQVLSYNGTAWVNTANALPWIDVTGTLTAGSTSITLSDASITTSSTIEVFTDADVDYNSISVTTGSVTITFDAQASNMGVKVRVS